MKPQVIGDEGGDEEIAVVVALLHAQIQRHAGTLAGVAQQLRLQLELQELVLGALVDQDRRAGR